MSNVVRMGGEQPTDPQALIRREELAAQVVAVMRAHFSRPGPDEMKEILRCAEGQIRAIEITE